MVKTKFFCLKSFSLSISPFYFSKVLAEENILNTLFQYLIFLNDSFKILVLRFISYILACRLITDIKISKIININLSKYTKCLIRSIIFCNFSIICSLRQCCISSFNLYGSWYIALPYASLRIRFFWVMIKVTEERYHLSIKLFSFEVTRIY